MARVIFDVSIRHIRGRLGGFVYRCYGDGLTQVGRVSLRKEDYRPSPAQSAQIERFKQAHARYSKLLEDPALRAAYEQVRAARGATARLHALVMGDIMKPPTIRNVDLSGYFGFPGNAIAVLAEDNVGVVRLVLNIHDLARGLLLEAAEQLPEPGHLFCEGKWVYRARVQVPAGRALEVRIEAYDLAGNKSEASRLLNL